MWWLSNDVVANWRCVGLVVMWWLSGDVAATVIECLVVIRWISGYVVAKW